MCSLVTEMHNCRITFNYFMLQWNIAVAIPVNVKLFLLYMWHNYITVLNHYTTIAHAMPGFYKLE